MVETKTSVPTIYFESWLMRKEGINTWIYYWAVIRGKWLQFFEQDESSQQKVLKKALELTTDTQCSLVKRRKRRFPFALNNGIGSYYLKCETELERYHWIISLLSAALGKPKTELPSAIPPSMVEKEAFKKVSKEKCKTQNNVENETKESPDNFHSKRRKKYAVRRENRIKRKEAKRAKKLGLDQSDYNASSADNSPVKETRGAISEFYSDPELYLIKTISTRQQGMPQTHRNTQGYDGKITVKASIQPLSKDLRNVNHGYDYDEDDIDILPTIPVTLNNEELLPNMVITEVTDSEEDDTEDTSLASQSSSFLSLSMTNIASKTLNKEFSVSSTFLCDDDDNNFEQRTLDGKIKSSSKSSTETVVKNSTCPVNGKSLLSPSRAKLVSNNLPQLPGTPLRQRPKTSQRSTGNFSRFLVNSSDT